MLQDELATALGISKSQLSQWKGRKVNPCPTDDIGKAKTWIAGNIKPRAKRKKSDAGTATVPAKDIPPVLLPPADSEHTWEARLERARKMEYCIFETIRNTINAKQYAQLQSLLSSWQRANQGLVEAERDSQAIRRESGELIHRDTARAIMAELLIPIRNALDLLPMSERARCNPQSPETAQQALTEWRDKLLRSVSQAATKF